MQKKAFVWDGFIFAGAKMSGINLSGASLVECNFDKARLNGANLCQANVSRARFVGADLSDGYVRGVRGFKEAKWDSGYLGLEKVKSVHICLVLALTN